MSSESVVDLFEAASRAFPSSAALVLESGESLSYRELDAATTALALGIAPHLHPASPGEVDLTSTPLVCVMMHRHAALVACFLAVLKCGAAYVPVDPSFPPERQAYIFGQSKCALLVTDEACFEAAKQLGVSMPSTIVVSSTTAQIVAPVNGQLASVKTLVEMRGYSKRREGGGLMYVLYTSGSTGKPKGVMVKSSGVLNTVTWFVRELQVGSGSRVLGLTTTCFDISMLEIFMPLVSGGTLVLATSAAQKNPFRLLDVVREQRVSVFQATPTTYEMMLATGWCGDPAIDFLVGGEAFRPALLPLLGRCRSLRNVYGPTETSIWSSSFTLPPSANQLPGYVLGARVGVPIGTPISATQFYLVDPTDTKGLAQGDEGELWIGGTGVAAGYLNAPELTSSRFIPNPFGEGTVYRTGDWVRRLPCGNFAFERRLDDQVKIDGFRIELEEVEAVFSSHGLVEQAVAVVRDNKLIVYLKAVHGQSLSPELMRDIETFAGRSLTHYMMPKYALNIFFISLSVQLGTLCRSIPFRSQPTENLIEMLCLPHPANRTQSQHRARSCRR